jgi:serine/threonine-protein kinase RsbT
VAPVSAGERVAVSTALDADVARRAARHLAQSVGFDAAGAESVALAATELATNLVRYARGGEIVLSVVTRPVPVSHVMSRTPGRGASPPAGGDAEPEIQRGMQVESRDAGPGMGDVAQALRDGFSTGGGLGGGLGAVRRLMDEFEITSASDGTHVVARKRVPVPRSLEAGRPAGAGARR